MRIIKDSDRYGSFILNNKFVTEYMPRLEGDAVKVYLYLCVLYQGRNDTSETGIMKALSLSPERLKKAVDALKREALILVEGKDIILTDIIDTEVRKCFSGNSFSGCPEVSVQSDEKEKLLSEAVNIIQSKYFGGKMIRGWFDLIHRLGNKMEPEVILLLFEHCEQYCVGPLKKAYVEKVAENWISENIKNTEDLEEYLGKRNVLNGFIDFIKRKMNRSAPFMDSEISVIKKWLYDYGYGAAELSLVLDWTKFNNPTIGAFDKVLSTWYNAGLTDAGKIQAFLEKNKKGSGNTNAGADGQRKPSGKGSEFSQRNYSEDFFNSLIAEGSGMKNDGEGQ